MPSKCAGRSLARKSQRLLESRKAQQESASLRVGHAGKQCAFTIERQWNELRIKPPSGGAETQRNLARIARTGGALEQMSPRQRGDGPADPGLVHARAGRDALRGTLPLFSDRDENSPLGNRKPEALSINLR